MPINFAKKPAAVAPAASPPSTSSAAPKVGLSIAPKPAPSAGGLSTSAKATQGLKPAPQAGKPAASPGNKPSFMKTGAAAKQLLAEDELKAQQRKDEQDKLRRFWMSSDKGVEKRITFLDGEIGDDGMLDIPMFHEHEVVIGQDRVRFVCTKGEDESEPCPICERGDSQPYLVGLLTVVDHTGYISGKKSKTPGKLNGVNTRYLYAAKRDTIAKLTKLAGKRGGLTGCTFDVSRDGDRSANVGSSFEFVEKYESALHAHAAFGGEVAEYEVADYATEITYRSPEELVEMGVGKAFTGVGVAQQKSMSSHL